MSDELKTFDIYDVIQELVGTTLPLETVLADHGRAEEDLTKDELDRIDEEIFLCHACGWWCSTDECNEDEGESLCDDCFAYDDE